MSLRILIADDEPIIRRDLKELLSGMGYTVIGDVGNGSEALRLLMETKPDVTILDIKMPGLDGIALAELVARDVCVILLTAYSSAPLVRAARTAGVMAYLTKPLREGDIAPAIELALENFTKQNALSGKVARLKEELENRKIIDRAKGLLMSRQGLSEAEAFRRIQRISMERNLTMRQVANTIIDKSGSA